ncbi:MAG: hypothetical protein ACRDWX_10200 [Acidimicrobiia bacterium]
MPEEASQSRERVRAAEVIAALSLATDLGIGVPLEHGLHSTLFAMRLGERLGVDSETALHTYYACLLFYVGCTATAEIGSEIFGDDDALTRYATPVRFGSRRQMMAGMMRAVAPPGGTPLVRARQIARRLSARTVIDQCLRGQADRPEAVAAFEAALQLPYDLEDFLADPDNPRQWAHIVDFDPLLSLRSVGVPTLLLYGTDDMWVPVGRSIHLWLESLEEAGNTDFAIARLAGTGHLPTLSWSDPLTEEGPIAPMYEELLIGWLRGHGLAT